MLLWLLPSLIPSFYLSVFKLPVRVVKHFVSLMKRFVWKGTRLGEGRGWQWCLGMRFACRSCWMA